MNSSMVSYKEYNRYTVCFEDADGEEQRRSKEVAEKNVRVGQDVSDSSRTVVKCAVGVTEEFKVEVCLH